MGECYPLGITLRFYIDIGITLKPSLSAYHKQADKHYVVSHVFLDKKANPKHRDIHTARFAFCNYRVFDFRDK